jgi:hypothetical protein
MFLSALDVPFLRLQSLCLVPYELARSRGPFALPDERGEQSSCSFRFVLTSATQKCDLDGLIIYISFSAAFTLKHRECKQSSARRRGGLLLRRSAPTGSRFLPLRGHPPRKQTLALGSCLTLAPSGWCALRDSGHQRRFFDVRQRREVNWIFGKGCRSEDHEERERIHRFIARHADVLEGQEIGRVREPDRMAPDDRVGQSFDVRRHSQKGDALVR